MIRPSSSLLCILALCIPSLLAGCGGNDKDAEAELPDWLSDIEGEPADAPEVATAADNPAAPAQHRAGREPRFKPGDRFPLRKIVEQELKQSSLDGRPQISRSRLELMLAITVHDVVDGRTLMQVRYDRVKYSHEIAGELVEYDSLQPRAEIPTPALAYHGMVNDGFAFWIGPDNQIAEVVDFHEFIDRCLAHITPEQRQQAVLDIEASAGVKGISDFVDNTIGLLPRDLEKAVGESWEQSRHIARPVPMHVATVYTLSDFNDETAEVTISGQITPSTTLGDAAQDDTSVRVTVNGGHSSGRCIIYRDSGLPKESKVERIVDMTVQLAGGIAFDQQKRTVTTVESFPLQALAGSAGAPRFQ